MCCFFQIKAKRDSDQALHTLPDGLEVKTSSIPNAGLGVFTLNDIQPRVMFGPYGGVDTMNHEEAHKSGYAWQVENIIDLIWNLLYARFSGLI